jgi:hypothetical protein
MQISTSGDPFTHPLSLLTHTTAVHNSHALSTRVILGIETEQPERYQLLVAKYNGHDNTN